MPDVPDDVSDFFVAAQARDPDALKLRAGASPDAARAAAHMPPSAGDVIYSSLGFMIAAGDAANLTQVAVVVREHCVAALDPDTFEPLWLLPLGRLEAVWWSSDPDDEEVMWFDAALSDESLTAGDDGERQQQSASPLARELDAAAEGIGGDARTLLPSKALALGALVGRLAASGWRLFAEDTNDDPRAPWETASSGGRQLRLMMRPGASPRHSSSGSMLPPTRAAANPSAVPSLSVLAAAPVLTVVDDSGSEEVSTSSDSEGDAAPLPAAASKQRSPWGIKPQNRAGAR